MKQRNILLSTVIFVSIASSAFADMIDRVIAREAEMSQISDAMGIKQTGLKYVRNLADFNRLSGYAFSNPSDGYQSAVADFIVSNVAQFVKNAEDLPVLIQVEGRVRTIDQAQKVKEAGLPFVRHLGDYEILTGPAFSNPSDGYLSMVSAFLAAHASVAIHPHTSIKRILELEARTKLTTEAIAVKTAGLAAVRSPEQFWDLTELAFSNPSEGYKQAVAQFIRDHKDQYGL